MAPGSSPLSTTWPFRCGPARDLPAAGADAGRDPPGRRAPGGGAGDGRGEDRRVTGRGARPVDSDPVRAADRGRGGGGSEGESPPAVTGAGLSAAVPPAGRPLAVGFAVWPYMAAVSVTGMPPASRCPRPPRVSQARRADDTGRAVRRDALSGPGRHALPRRTDHQPPPTPGGTAPRNCGAEHPWTSDQHKGGTSRSAHPPPRLQLRRRTSGASRRSPSYALHPAEAIGRHPVLAGLADLGPPPPERGRKDRNSRFIMTIRGHMIQVVGVLGCSCDCRS